MISRKLPVETMMILVGSMVIIISMPIIVKAATGL
jgi:hypothetical protein